MHRMQIINEVAPSDPTQLAQMGEPGAGVVPLVAERGGRIVFSGAVNWLMLGQADDLWDQVAVVEYPNRGALLAMAMSDAYQEIAVHRSAGLAGQLNIEATGLFVPA